MLRFSFISFVGTLLVITFQNCGVGYKAALLPSGEQTTAVEIPPVPPGDPGDFDGDGIVDILAFEEEDVDGGKRTQWTVALGSESGDFATPEVWMTGGKGEVNLVGDFNNDGKADAVSIYATGDWTISFSEGDRFTLVSGVLSGYPPGISQEVGDFNADGKDDVFMRKAIPGGGEIWLYMLYDGRTFVVQSL